ncbi:MAG: hypothetical protein V3U29_00330 [Phycisphaeraceae bacterium]
MAEPTNHNEPNAVIFRAYPKLLFCWPLIAVGVLFWFVASVANHEVLGWLYLLTVSLVLLTVGIDVKRNYALLWVAVFCLFYFLGRWLQDTQGFTFFGNIYKWFAGIDVQHNASFGLALSIFLAVPYAVMLIWGRFQHKWRVTPNEFEHYSFGRANDSLAPGPKRVRTAYPDLLELLLCGSGTLIVYSATDQSELRRFHHVPLLPLLRRRIDRILAAAAVTSTDAVFDEQAQAEQQELADTQPAGDRRTEDIDEEGL